MGLPDENLPAAGSPSTPIIAVEFVDDADESSHGPDNNNDVRRIVSLGGGADSPTKSFHATITSPWREEENTAVAVPKAALPVPHPVNDFDDEALTHNPDKDDPRKIHQATLGAQRRMRHNSWFGQIQSPWLTEFSIDVEDTDENNEVDDTNTADANGAGPAVETLSVPKVFIFPPTDKESPPLRAVDPESPWVQKWHVHIEDVEKHNGDFTVGQPHESKMDISHLHPVNDFHIEKVDLKHMHQLSDHTLGGYRAKKHPSWHSEVKAQWMDEYNCDSDDDAAVTTHHPHELGGESRKKHHASWHGEAEDQWMSEYGINPAEMKVPHPVNDHPDTDLGAKRRERHASWAAPVQSPWLEEPYEHPVNDHEVDTTSLDRNLSPVGDLTLGGQRAQKHDSWRASVTSPWLDDNGEEEVIDYDIVSMSPHLRDLTIY